MPKNSRSRYDAIIIGSGFGGCLTALALLESGMRVLMLERGRRVERGESNWGDEGVFVLTPHYTHESRYSHRSWWGWRPVGLCACVGGPSIFYGGASFRFREADFTPPREITENSAAEWPLSYPDLEPHYGRVERLLAVAGDAGIDPTEPYRSEPFPVAPMPLAGPSLRIRHAALSLGLRPFRIPMAISSSSCVSCQTCDAFACAVSAKNDLATRVIPSLVAKGLELRAGTVVTKLSVRAGRIEAIEAVDSSSAKRLVFSADRVVLAAGAIATPHLLLASGLDRMNPGGGAVGRYLMRHCNAMVYGFFHQPPNAKGEHHKQLAFNDFYFGEAGGKELGKLGNIQQIMAPPSSLIRAMLPMGIGRAVSALTSNLTGLLTIAEDQPRFENRVSVASGPEDRFGLPPARIEHRYSRRDLAARTALLRRARQILRKAGAIFTVAHKVDTFSHAVGTVRMGTDPKTSALDRDCRFRGVENLWVADGSVLPTSAGVNPSLTIAANALRVGSTMAAAG